MRWLVVILLVGLVASATVHKVKFSEDEAAVFLKKENDDLAKAINKITIASWNQESDITPEHETALEVATKEYDQFKKNQSERAAAVENYDKLSAPLRRQFEKMIVIGTSALSEEDGATFQKAVIDMIKTYSTAKVTVVDKPNLELEPDLTEMFAQSQDADELREAWYKWREETGKKMRENYLKYIELGNKAATLNQVKGREEFKTFDDLWMFVWESTDIKQQVTELMDELKEFYAKIHAYVRFHLQKRYPTEMPADGTIPAHLLGNMWAQDFSNLLTSVPEMNPHNDVKPIDEVVNKNLKEWSVRDMFDASDVFFQGLGMENMTDDFWKNSIIEKPADKEMVCHASAWDFFEETDFRIKQCTDKTLSDLQTVHHEMGHIQYFMQYREQPAVYRDGGNPGFHEAIGDLIALSVVTPKHLQKIGLIDGDPDFEKINLNYQMKMALEKVAFLPFSFVMDKWRWDVFSNETAREKMNQRWWELRLQYQGISPPVLRSEKDFDPGAKYHVPAGVEYVRYFVSHVLQFQFFEKMCSYVDKYNETNLYTCDFDQNKDAGAALMKLLKAGSSDSWKTILKDFIGDDVMSLSGLKTYFGPLNTYLETFIQENNIVPGWQFDNVDKYMATENAVFLDQANKEYRYWSNKMGLASWAQSSNITNENTEALKVLSAKYAVWRKDLGEKAKEFEFGDDNIYEKRQFEKFAVYGTSALPAEDGNAFNDASLRMKTVYSEAKVEVDGNILELEPGLVDLMATSSDPEILKEAWIKWRDATGPKMREDYIAFYKLGNKAAKLNSLKNQTFETFDALWMFEWESPKLKEQVDDLMGELKDLYQKIHAYVREHLKNHPKYKDQMPDDGTIPAHLVGNMWAQQWGNLLNIIPEMNPAQGVDPIDKIVNKNLEKYTEWMMFDLSEAFFYDLTMDNMTQKFRDNSIVVKPDDRNLTCHASAWDFYDAELDDFRIKQCTEKTMNDLVTVHHEMGHVQYYMNYKVKEPIFRRGANPGFHEAIGDLIALSVSTPKHLQKVGLYDPNGADTEKINLNYQMKMALDKIAFLPFSYVMDKWRWDVFGGGENMERNMNRRWWELRLEHQGVSPPINRSEADFDPGAKYHIPANVEYVRYFVSHVLQFQFFEKMCSYVDNFNETNLYTCDFDKNKEAGAALKKMLVQGSSDYWPKILEDFTGSENMTLSSLNKYFGPLKTYLEDYIEKNNVTVGWTVDVDKYMEHPEITTPTSPPDSSPTTPSISSTTPKSSSTNLVNMTIVTIISLIASIMFR